MYSRWFSVCVFLFWMVSMGWLIQQKILPPLVVGDPPTYRSILSDHRTLDEPVGWTISLNDEPLGWATSRAGLLDNGVTEFKSKVRLARLPVAEITPVWLKPLLRMLGSERELSALDLSVIANGTLDIDPLGRPIGFNSTATFGDWQGALAHPRDFGRTGAEKENTGRDSESAFRFQVVMQGTVDGNQLKLKVRSGDFVYNTSTYLASDALMTDALSPQARLPHLKVGQSWTVPVYSPLRPPTSPMEVLHAKVERHDTIVWRSHAVPALLVVFRGDPGAELTNGQAARARAWVGPDGTVLKQELLLLQARLTFERLAADDELLRNERP
ncbi:MAG TPA: hypothetical protein VGX78_02280 [Pirellulales bacterium]|jgi:hypothetical protein|nr:hypothetical protein [Pirellulales bacterium]